MAQTLFTNARLVLDGCGRLQPGHELLVEDGLIRAVSATPLPRPLGSTVIDVGQRTLMPGLIDA
ncbi:MAG: amidohydrolase family protein, partial [Burkholderiaceae bacterium]|nr:amidohydrolase family protein [Burkholderiaceae bacterium]